MLAESMPWLLFLAFVLIMLALDLGVFHRDAHEIGRREALGWSAFWIGLAVAFNVGVYIFQGSEKGLEWTTGYVIEKSLSVDNIFVFLMIFSAFAVPAQYQHRVLFWGIIGALVTRVALIAAGAALLGSFHFIIYIFGAFLIFTGIKFLRDSSEHVPTIEHNLFVRVARRFLPVTEGYEGQKLFTRRNGALFATPLFLVLLVIESTDVVFAVDSIPAIYAVTDDPFIVFTSNVFAILGLRSLYFVLNGYMSGFTYLKPALASVLVFVGTKMLLVDVYKIHPLVSLGVIVTIISVAVIASIAEKRRKGPGTTLQPGVPSH